MKLNTILTSVALIASGVVGIPVKKRDDSCPDLHVFGARETTAPPGYGSAGTFVDLILDAHPGATSQAIDYPAAGGENAIYASSVQNGTADVAYQINIYNAICPNTTLVYVGYSQGAQIMDNALCGGGDPGQGVDYNSTILSESVIKSLKAIIWAGDPRHTPGSPYNYGNSTAGGFDARPEGFTCGNYSSIIRSYCDAADPYCSNGSDANVHQGYGAEYGDNALEFVNSLLDQ